MSRNIRYEMLQTEEEENEAVQPTGATAPVDITDVESNITVSTETSTGSTATEDAQTQQTPTQTAPGMPVPPPYSVAVDLPSYEEAERTKQEEAARREEQEASEPASNRFRLLAILSGRRTEANGDKQLGTDGMFLCTFLFAFVFNWIGLLGSLCITESIAGRLGAMSGFGLSLVKWVAIMKHSTWAAGMSQGDSWLWWLLIVMGFLIFVRGCTQYIRIKFHWPRLSQSVRNNIFYYF